ncbi:MAG: uridine diphosphate-N-acetylglucosamine-binding protein YvcK [Patescibacteria group bacterium]|nr:uridine diphosphate-N-acetylglucosamine-binding protein YvcK [Patescibacteria group bacterium]
MKIAVLGGGTGTYYVLSGLKRLEDVELCAIVSIADSGGSSGIIRIEQGALPPGDILRAMLALSDGGEFLRSLLTYRFEGGSLNSHTIGNLLITGSEKLKGGSLDGIRALHDVFRIRGRVIPVAAVAANLLAEHKDGRVTQGECNIDVPVSQHGPIQRCYLDPPVRANTEALDAIKSADIVVLCPGDLYTSLIPVLLVDGIVDALYDTTARIVYVVNLITKKGETDGYTAREFCRQVAKYIAPAELGTVIVNTTRPSDDLLQKYDQAGVCLVEDDLNGDTFEVVREALLSESMDRSPDNNNPLHKLIRHNPVRLARAIVGSSKPADTMRNA